MVPPPLGHRRQRDLDPVVPLADRIGQHELARRPGRDRSLERVAFRRRGGAGPEPADGPPRQPALGPAEAALHRVAGIENGHPRLPRIGHRDPGVGAGDQRLRQRLARARFLLGSVQVQQIAHADAQLVDLQGLLEEIGGAGADRGHPGLAVAIAGDDDDGQMPGAVPGAQAGHRLDPGHVGQVVVEDRQIGAFGAGRQPLGRRGTGHDAIGRHRLQRQRQDLQRDRMIPDNDDAHHRPGWLLRASLGETT